MKTPHTKDTPTTEKRKEDSWIYVKVGTCIIFLYFFMGWLFMKGIEVLDTHLKTTCEVYSTIHELKYHSDGWRGRETYIYILENGQYYETDYLIQVGEVICLQSKIEWL